MVSVRPVDCGCVVRLRLGPVCVCVCVGGGDTFLPEVKGCNRFHSYYEWEEL